MTNIFSKLIKYTWILYCLIFSLAISLHAYAETQTWTFDSDGNYTYSDSTELAISNGVLSLQPVDQTDDDNDVTAGWGAANMLGVQWDNVNSWIDFNTLTNVWALPSNSSATGWNGAFDASSNEIYLNLDESNGATSFTDNSANGISMTCSTCPTQTDSGKLTGAFTFSSAQTQTINSGTDIAALQIIGDMTISFWANFGSVSYLSDLVAYGQAGSGLETGNYLYKIGTDNGGRITFGHEYGAGSYEGSVQTPGLTTSHWYHIALTRNSTTKLYTLYINGAAAATYNYTNAPTGGNAGPALTIGGQTDVVMDEVAVFSDDLSSSMIWEIYNRQAPDYAGYLTSRVMDAGASSAWSSFDFVTDRPVYKQFPASSEGSNYTNGNFDTTSLAGLWHFDEDAWVGNADEVVDSSGNGHHGVATNATTVTTGFLKNAGIFDGTGDYITIADHADLKPANLTVEFWIRPNPLYTWDSPLMKASTSSWVDGYGFYYNGAIKFFVTSYSSYSVAGTLPRHQWSHVVGTYDGTDIKLYINGSEVDSLNYTGGITHTTANLLVGTAPGGSSPDGYMDELAIYGRAVSATEVLDHYRRGMTRLKFQVRSCDDANCNGETFAGPGGSTTAYYSELLNSSATTASLSLDSNDVPNNRYFQYIAYLESYDTTYEPELKSVSVGPGRYPTDTPTATNILGATYSTLSAFTETLGGSNAGSIKYQLSPDNNSWYYWDTSNWVSASGVNQTNTSGDINTNISSFPTDISTGTLYYKAFFISDGSQAVELDTLAVTHAPKVNFSANQNESEGGDGTMVVTATLDYAISEAVTVPFTISGTATERNGQDYLIDASPITINAWQTTGTATIYYNNDVLDEDDETVILTMGSPTNAVAGITNTHTATITDNDDVPLVTLMSSSDNGAESGGSINVGVVLGVVSGRTATVDYAVTGTATGGGVDYTLADGTVTFTAGDQLENITLNLVDDSIFELQPETVIITLSNPSNATISGAITEYTYTITDNEAIPTVTFTSASQSLDEGTGNVTITAQMSGVSGDATLIPFTVNGASSATGGGTDYSITSSPVTIAAGQTTTTITVTGVEDALDEANETVIIDMGGPVIANQGAIIQHVVTITDDDDAPSVTFSSASQSGAEGNGAMTFTADLSAVSGQVVLIPFTVSGTATVTTDYAITSSPLIVSAGNSNATITITPVNDTTDEADETIIVTMGSLTNATEGATAVHTATITDDDAVPTISINDASSAEGSAATFTATLSAASGKAITVAYATADNTAVAGTDYTAATGTLSFSAGDLTKQFTVTTTSDVIDEADETYYANISSPTNATLNDAQGIGTITDDDDIPGLSINDVTVTEGNSGTVTAIFTVTLSAASGQVVTVAYATTDRTATAGTDYTAASGTLTFSAGDLTKSIAVTVIGDETDEGDSELFYVNLSSATNATISDSQGVGTITDDDDESEEEDTGSAPIISISAPVTSSTYREGASITLRTSVEDADGDSVFTYAWTQTAGLATGVNGGSGSTASGTIPSLTAALPDGRYRMLFGFSVTATDENGNESAPASIVVYGIKRSSVAGEEGDEEGVISETREGDSVGYASITGELNEVAITEGEEETSIEVRKASDAEVLAIYTTEKTLADLLLADVGQSTDADIVFGIPSYSQNQGALFIIYGPDLSSHELTADSMPVDSSTTVTGLDITGDVTIKSQIGRLLAAGDVNADDINDVLFTGFDNAYVLYGSETPESLVSLNSMDETIYEADFDDAVDLNSADRTGDGYDDCIYITAAGEGYVITSPFYSGYVDYDIIPVEFMLNEITASVGISSESISLISGDFNNDGIEDVALGDGLLERAMIFYGSAEASSTLSVDTADVIISGVDVGDLFGGSLAAGDVDGDGVVDLVIGARGDDGEENALEDAGAFYVVFGSASLASAINAEDLFVVYNGTAGEEAGRRLFVADIDGDGISEVIYGTSANKSVITYMSSMTAASDEMLVTLGDNNPAEQEISGNINDNVVMMQLRVMNILDEDAVFNSIELTANGNADESVDVAAVRLYVDVDEDGAITEGDYQVGVDHRFTEDNGTITFSDLAVVIGGGESVYILVVYDIELYMSYSGQGFSIMSYKGMDIDNFTMFLGVILLSVCLIWILRTRGIMNKTLIIVILFFAQVFVFSGCGSGSSDDVSDGITFNVSVTSNDNIDVETSVSKAAVSVAGAPVTSGTVTVK